MRKIIEIACLAAMIGLASCAIKPDPTDPGPPPSDYRQTLKSYIYANFFDPYATRDIAISAPVRGHLFKMYGWLICLRANAKNPKEGYMGGYMGLSTTAYLIKNNAVVRHEDKSAFCDTQKLVPWPEMENSSGGSQGQNAK